MTTLLLSAVLALTGCSPGTVTTVQPNAVAKSALDGEWFWRHTVSDVPYGTAATFLGAQGPLERIRWEIEEDLLLGYRTYTHVDEVGAEETVPVVAFPILDQFDIRRGYDRTTGEESNVVEENRERPWYEREYLRVDWSQNVAQGSLLLAGLPVQVDAWVTGDDRAEDAPQFDDSDADGTIDSLMLTQRALAAPDTTEYPGYGDVPVCLFFGQAEYQCGPTEIGITHSFLRVDTRAPVVGLPYDDRNMETFGFFSTERLTYDRGYGLLEPNRVRYANRHPLWQRTVQTDDAGRPLCVGDDGRTGTCASFSVDDAPQVLEIPVLDREVRPIVYHPSLDFPDDLRPIMVEVADQWNEPLRDAINGQRWWACIDAGGDPLDCTEQLDEDLQAFVWCPNNPSLPTDPAVCSTDHTGPFGRPDGIGDPARVGDLRYHLAAIVRDPQLSSPYGYGPSAADPAGATIALADGELTLGAGEIVQGNAFLYEHVLDRVSHQVADLVQLLNGEVSPDAFVQGEDLSAFVDAVADGDSAALAGRTWEVPTTWSSSLVADRLSRMDNGFAPLIAPYTRPLGKPTHPSQIRAYLEAATDAIDQSGVFGAGAAQADAAFGAMLASPYDDLAWTPETVGGYGFDPATSPDALTGRSPFELIDPRLQAEREQWRVLAGQNAVDLDEGHDAAFSDGALLGLARDYAKRGLSYDEIVTDVRLNSFREVMLHEVGHTLGLRHNFSGSFDAFNFRPEYWALRDDGEMGPRHVDPETDAEIDGRIREYQYSTIMDYPGSRNVGWVGLGHYDEAAVKFGYGELVEVLTAVPEEEFVQGLPNDVGISFVSAYASSNVLPSVLLFYTSGAILDLHYTDYPGMAGDLEARADVPLDRLVPTLDDTGSFADGYVVGDGRGAGKIRPGMPAVPYRFCSDEFAVGITCARFDEGADPYESQAFLMERYWNDYILNNFARMRYGFGDPAAYVSRLDDRTFDPLRTWQRYYALFHGIFEVDTDPFAQEFFAADRGWGGWTAATDASFRFLAQVVTRPEAGPHAFVDRPDGVRVLAPSFDSEDAVPLIAGAYFESEWDTNSGYYWFEHQSRVGTYWDRMLALHTLTNTASYNFLGYDTATDPRQYAIGYQDLYRDSVAVLLGRLMADDVGALAPARLDDGSFVYPDPLRTDQSWPPAGADRVAPATYWLVRYDADLFGLALLAHGYDRSFLNRSRVYVAGGADAIEPGPGQALVSFTDPNSGKTFTAWSFPLCDGDGVPVPGPDGQPVELGSSARMLQHAQALADRCVDPALDDAAVAAACAELERFVADLDLHLEMYASFEHATP